MSDIIVVHGCPGAGKSTHAKRLAEARSGSPGIYHISAGERLRAIRTSSYNSRYRAQVNDPNAPAPLNHLLVTKVVFEDIALCPPCSLVLVDGFPRLPEAVTPFLEAIREGNHKLLGCLYLEVSQDTSMRRMAIRGPRGGERYQGSTLEIAAIRYQEFITATKEAIRLLGELAPVIQINAESNEQGVWELFEKAVSRLVIGSNVLTEQ